MTNAKRKTATAKKAPAKTTAPKKERIEAKEKRNMSDTLKKYRANYKGGKRTDDNISEILIPVTPDEMPALAEGLLGLEPGELEAKYSHLNRGQVRMNCGNRIRGAFKREELTVKEIKAAINAR